MPDSHPMRFDGEKLREIRKARRLDQTSLAALARKHAAGITQSSVSRHEGGMQPTGRTALAYAKALGVNVDVFYDGETAEEPLAPLTPEEQKMFFDLLSRALAGSR